MAGIRNESKCPKNTTVCLNDLPDDILLRILSFLPTKSLVATSLLSRKWQFLWTSTRNLQLHESPFIVPRDRRGEFLNFVERALVLRDRSPLISFSLACTVRNDASRINTWITSAIRSNVEQLSLCLLRFQQSFVLPSSIFVCRSLVKLELRMMISIRVPSMICLPRLKHLTLMVEFADNESAEKLLSHPLLEELILYNCAWFNIKTVNVNSPKLQSLSIEDEDKDDWSKERLIRFFGDNLKSLRYEGDSPPTQYCICGSTTQLREAEILISIPNHDVLDMDVASNRYLKLINSLSRVQNLTLSDETAQSLYLLSQRPGLQTLIPVFECVTRLNLTAYDDPINNKQDGAWIEMIFKRCPLLEHLNFMEAVAFESIKGNLQLLRPMPSCFRTHLKQITLNRYDPECEEQANAIHVMLNSAPVLEEMVVHCKRDACISGEDPKVAGLERELNTRPKASENCRVLVYSSLESF